MVVLGQSGCIRAKWLFSGKSGCNRPKVVKLGQKLMYSGKMVLFGLYLDKEVVLGQKLLY